MAGKVTLWRVHVTQILVTGTFVSNMDLLTNLILCVASVLFFSTAEGYFITIDAHAEECFFDKVTSGTKMSLMFEVAEGGFLDIDVKARTNTRNVRE